MSVERKFPKVAYWSMVKCPFCLEDKPVIANGLVDCGKETKMVPDRGYAFCNCKNIWYTDWSNIDKEAEDKEQSIDTLQYYLANWLILNQGYKKNKMLVVGSKANDVRKEANRLGFLSTEEVKKDSKFNTIWSYHQIEKSQFPLHTLQAYYYLLEPDGVLFIATPDPFCIEFDNAYSWGHWLIRRNHIMWDMDSLCDEVEKIGFKIDKKLRNINIEPNKDFHLILRK